MHGDDEDGEHGYDSTNEGGHSENEDNDNWRNSGHVYTNYSLDVSPQSKDLSTSSLDDETAADTTSYFYGRDEDGNGTDTFSDGGEKYDTTEIVNEETTPTYIESSSQEMQSTTLSNSEQQVMDNTLRIRQQITENAKEESEGDGCTYAGDNNDYYHDDEGVASSSQDLATNIFNFEHHDTMDVMETFKEGKEMKEGYPVPFDDEQ
eukprot:14467983-Ditylum_brightwellii.AAC.1